MPAAPREHSPAPTALAHALVSLFEIIDSQLNFLTTGTYRVTVVEQSGSLRFSNIAVHLDRAS
jgi:hypothetical protein